MLDVFGLDNSNMGRMAVSMVTYAGRLLANFITGNSIEGNFEILEGLIEKKIKEKKKIVYFFQP